MRAQRNTFAAKVFAAALVGALFLLEAEAAGVRTTFLLYYRKSEFEVGNNLLQIWKLRFGHKAKLLFRLSAQGLVRSLKLKFRQDFEAEVWSVFCC